MVLAENDEGSAARRLDDRYIAGRDMIARTPEFAAADDRIRARDARARHHQRDQDCPRRVTHDLFQFKSPFRIVLDVRSPRTRHFSPLALRAWLTDWS